MVVLLPYQAAGRAGQGTAGRVAGTQGPGLQRGQDADRPRSRGFDFLGFTVRRYRGKLLIKPSKAAIKRVRQGSPTEMRALRGGNATAVLATISPITRGWAAYYRASGVVQDVHHPGPTTCGSSPTSGPAAATRTSRSTGSSAGTSAGSTRPGRTTGYSATATAAPTCPSSPGRRSSGTAGHRPGIPRRPRPDRLLGPTARQEPDPRSTAAPCACSPGRTGAARSAGTCSCTPTASHHSPAEWEQWHRTTRKAITRQTTSPPSGPARRMTTRLIHASLPAPGNRRPAARNQHTSTPEPPSGLA